MVPAHFPRWLNREIVNGYTELQKNVAAGKLQPEKKAVDENEKLNEAKVGLTTGLAVCGMCCVFKAFTAAVRGKTEEKADTSGSGEEGQQESVKEEAPGQAATKRTSGVGRIRIAR